MIVPCMLRHCSVMQGQWIWVLAVIVGSVVGFQEFLEVNDNSVQYRMQRSWDALPHPDNTGNLIFNSIASLLQQWPNIRHRNGHVIVPVTIVPGTVLYHGRTDNVIPEASEWLAMDPEYAYIICGDLCHLTTFVTTRELRLVYFDGSSASPMSTGTMDSQDIFFWGKIREDMTYDEYGRIQEGCAWRDRFAIDGYLRMQLGFEIMKCNFTDGLRIVSKSRIIPRPMRNVINVHDPLTYSPVIPPGWRGSIRTYSSVTFSMLESASWNYYFPGDARVRVDYSGLFTFYDPALTSLVAARIHQTRDEYRVANISTDDITTACSQLTDVLVRKDTRSGIDWGSIVHVVIDRYGDRLKLVKHLLESSSGSDKNASEQAQRVRAEVLTMLTPYMLTDAIASSSSGSRSWIAPVAHECATTLTRWAPIDILTRQEKTIVHAIDDVLHEICRVCCDIWLDAFGIEEASGDEAALHMDKWKRDVDNLMSWLDWSVWDTCDPACGIEELCYAPMWPWLRGVWGWYPPDGDDATPRCIHRVEPYPGFFEM